MAAGLLNPDERKAPDPFYLSPGREDTASATPMRKVLSTLANGGGKKREVTIVTLHLQVTRRSR